ncbi:MAG: 2-octaprenyl-3-methyl-6-methoxy-1,4-benzoquinol hydroxylase, partial [Chitinophagaceae bacterium]|nr:2-octaprenyl-3-methyl-6-methoxy-1,4-benzoquinol hydroxylase [Rubrivivax sp.]
MPTFDVLVRGAGAVGLAGALALSRQGLKVGLWAPPASAAAASGPDVRAYALNAESVALLTELKVWHALPAGARTAVYDMRIEGDRPGAVLEFSAWSHGVGELAWIVDAAALEAALVGAVGFSPHITRVGDGATADLQVLAEGRDSASRERLGIRMPRQAYGQRGLAARLWAPQPHAGLARQWFRSPDVLALLPLDQPQLGRADSGYGLVWSVPDARADTLMAMDDASFEAALMDATAAAAGPLRLAGARA